MTTFEINQMTDNTYDDINPQVSEIGNLAWEVENDSSLINPQVSGYLGVYESENTPDNHDIYLFRLDSNGNYSELSIATSTNNETNPHIAGNFIVYEYEYAPDDHDIYLLEIETSDTGISISNNPVNIASSANDEINPQVAGNFVVYEYEYASDDHDIFLYEIETGNTQVVAQEVNNETNAFVSNTGDVVYEYKADANNTDIKFYDYLTGNTITLANTQYDELNPQIAGNYVTWQAWDGNDWEVYIYDSVNDAIFFNTDNSNDDINPQISELGYLVWQNLNEDTNYDILLYDGAIVLGLATSSFDEINPQITDNYVAWQGWDGNDWEIYGTEVII